MVNEIEQLEEECIKAFADMTEDEKQLILKQWTEQVSAWIFRAKKYIADSQHLQESLKINQQLVKRTSKASKSFTWINELFKNRRFAANQLTNQSILTDGYVLLNKIGEIIRGEEILYSITITTTGQDIVSSSAGEVFTYVVTLDEFLHLLSFTSQRVVMRSPTAIHKLLKETYRKEGQEWSQDKIDEFTAFSDQARSNNFYKYFEKNYSKINNGNLLEAYLRHKRNGYTIQDPPPTNNHGYWSAIFHSVQNTMAAPDAFYLGGDIDNEQIKGLNASVTNLTTLLINLQQVLQILTSTKIGADVVRSRVKKSSFSSFEASVDQSVEDVISQLLDKFTSKVIRS